MLLALEFTPTPGTVLGCDLAGVIIQVGKNVTGRKVGERVAAFVHGGNDTEHGAFAEYAKSTADLVWPIPDGLFFEEAATMSIGSVHPTSPTATGPR